MAAGEEGCTVNAVIPQRRVRYTCRCSRIFESRNDDERVVGRTPDVASDLDTRQEYN